MKTGWTVWNTFIGEMETTHRPDWVYKILNEKETKFFWPALDTHGLREYPQRLFKPRCRMAFFSNRI